MMHFVLVHGAWQWRDMAPLIRAAGLEVSAPTLTGLGHGQFSDGPQFEMRALQTGHQCMLTVPWETTDIILGTVPGAMGVTQIHVKS